MTYRPHLALAGAVALIALWALTLGGQTSGSPEMGLWEVLRALGSDQTDRATLIVQTVRLPRVLAGLLTGAALATAGSMLQAVTRNPLADPGLLGVNAGAAFAVVLLVSLGFGGGRGSYALAAAGGAGMAVVVVHILGSAGKRGASPLRLMLAGVVTGSFLAALTGALLIASAGTIEAVRFWTAGSLSGLRAAELKAALPWLGAGLGAAVLSRRQIGVLAMGEDLARGLGLDLRLWWAASVVMVGLLAGAAVSLAGPLGFVGLIVPHMVRLLTGAGYGASLPLVMLGGAGAVVLADSLPRALTGRDIPVGIALALVGAPVFVWLARGRAGATA